MKRAPNVLVVGALLTPLALLAACTGGPAEHYGFVTLLGRDTVAVERITRTPTRLVTDEVDRWPAVRLRHTEIALAPDGSPRHMEMDIRTPNATTPRARARHVTADMTGNSVKIWIRDSSSVKDTAFATGGAITVPHVSMMYSVIELEIAAALKRETVAQRASGDSIGFRQFYPDRDIGPSFVLHHGWVHPVGGGKVELWHDWLAGIGDVTVDSAGRTLTYSGVRSTYQVNVTRVAVPPDVEASGARLVAAEKAQGGIKQLSVRDTARGTIGSASIVVDYGRPLARGRVLLGNVIPYGEVWRTGANAATQFTTTAGITLGGLRLAPGTYTLWTVPFKDHADLIVNKQFGQWGTSYDESQNLGTARLHAETPAAPVEEFTISVVPTDARHGMLVLEWGTFRWTEPIVVR